MNVKKLLAALTCIALLFACTACNLFAPTPDSGETKNPDYIDGGTNDEYRRVGIF